MGPMRKRMARKRKLIGTGFVVLLVLALLITFAPACGNGEEAEPEITPTPGVTPTPTPGFTPTPTPEAKTLKIGVMCGMSGAGAAWGLAIRDGVEFAVDEINEAGGIFVGGERYLIKAIPFDDKWLGSEAALGAQRLIFDEKVKFQQGPPAAAPVDAAVPIFEENHIPIVVCAGGEVWGTPDHPYVLVSMCTLEAWMEAFWKQAAAHLAEGTTVYSLIGLSPTAQANLDYEKAAMEKRGLTQVGADMYDAMTSDFYPVLTKVVAKNPDAISFCASAATSAALMVKQVRELGFEGRIIAPYGVPISLLVSIAGAEASEGMLQHEPDWTSSILPKAMRDLTQKFIEEKQPEGGVMVMATQLYYASTMMMAAAMEAADSLDPDKVLAAARAPGFKWQAWGFEASLGGLDTTGINSFMPTIVGCSEVRNGELVLLSYEIATDP